MAKVIHAFFICVLFPTLGSAQISAFHVLPWNGQKAAVSLSFDDARPVHLDVAVPELNKRHLQATFFLTISKVTRLDDWRRAQSQGHEIGNHSVSHEHPAALNQESEETQVEDAKNFLESNFHSDIMTFAYPYMETSPGLLFWVKRYDFAARGWIGNGDLLYVRPDPEPDWYNLPAQPVLTKYDDTIYQGWINKALSLSAWTTLQFHGIGDPATGWEPIPTNTFRNVLDYLETKQTEGLWVAPFGTVAAYLRAQTIVEKAHPQVVNGEKRFTWEIPAPFPHGVLLKVKLDDPGRLRLYQRGHKLHAIKEGFYLVSFDSRELVLKGEL